MNVKLPPVPYWGQTTVKGKLLNVVHGTAWNDLLDCGGRGNPDVQARNNSTLFMSELGEKHIDKYGSFHIGKRIKAVFDESGMSVVELARRLHRERSTVYSIFERRSIDVELLVNVSEALNHNFLEDVNAHFGLLSSGAGLRINLSVDALDKEQMAQLLGLLNEVKDQM